MDISKIIQPKSDQQNYDDYIAGPKTVTVSDVRVLETDQPLELHLTEFPGRPYKPNLSMRRVLIGIWGNGVSSYIGRSLRLYGDPTVKFGKYEVGGIKISHLSHIDEPKTIMLTVTRGRKEPFTVQPLTTRDAAAAWLQAASTMEELQKAWAAVQQAGYAADLSGLKDARKQELT
ncbi:hypothetical protein MUN78_16405 [Leucobacter allii]|uniref:Uncharacterized protein n=1 Tax=Leucobacter allii TaxID=2932247 RepID=A0ABY4FLP6_9MICO|nr:hypothetical protein [Leucobacter allii]UOQ57212.1 hypothetical protein MUN78_16405 [Leucobacter allii]